MDTSSGVADTISTVAMAHLGNFALSCLNKMLFLPSQVAPLICKLFSMQFGNTSYRAYTQNHYRRMQGRRKLSPNAWHIWPFLLSQMKDNYLSAISHEHHFNLPASSYAWIVMWISFGEDGRGVPRPPATCRLTLSTPGCLRSMAWASAWVLPATRVAKRADMSGLTLRA
jgi:hypothetical protein